MAAENFFTKTKSIFLWSRLLNTPFFALFNILYIIIYKELHATPFQIAVMIAIKPIASLISPYWSAHIHARPDRIRANLTWANLLKYLPFLLFPFIQSVWFCVFAFGFYMIFVRGVIPAWMEIFKRNIKGEAKERLCAVGSLIDYIGTGILPLALGWILDDYPGSWRWLFFSTAIVGILSTIAFLFLPTATEAPVTTTETNPFSTLLKPWKESWMLMKTRPDFRYFQIGFMFGGSALMIIQPSLPSLFVDLLGLSYKEMALAIAFCKTVGFILSSPFWVKNYARANIFRFCSLVTLTAALFPIILYSAVSLPAMLYVAWLSYGVMQAGSELSWNMSGIAFAKNEESSPYSTTNVLTVGLRGCFAPLIGSLLLTYTNSTTILTTAALLAFIATFELALAARRFQVVPSRSNAI